MLFQIYGETAGFQLLGWLLVFVGLILANESAHPCMVLRPCSAAGSHRGKRPVEQGRLDSEPGQYTGFVVHVRPGVPSVPGPQHLHHHSGALCRRLHGCSRPPRAGESRTTGRHLHPFHRHQCAGTGADYQARQRAEAKPYKNEIFTDTKDFQLALARAEDK